MPTQSPSPHLGESYISTGSLYLASTVLLPLGLPPADPFWSAPPPAGPRAAFGVAKTCPPTTPSEAAGASRCRRRP